MASAQRMKQIYQTQNLKMEELLTKIKTNDITEVKKWFLANPIDYKRVDFSRLVEFVDGRKMLRTLFDICGKEISVYYKMLQKSILIQMIREGKNLKIIKATIKLDKDFINQVDGSGMTALLYATNFDTVLVKYLLKNNADVNIGNMWGETPLHLANNLKVVKLLIKYGADINRCDIGGLTPLMAAIKCKRDEKIILMLLKNNADVEFRNYRGQTCLHLALRYGYGVSVIKQISRKILNRNIEDYEGLTPLCYALKDKNTYIRRPPYPNHFIYKLINKGFVVKAKVLMHAVKHCRDFNLIVSLTSFVGVKCYDEDGNCVLHHANDTQLIKMLVRHGAFVNHKNNDGQTPLMYAIIHRKSIKIIESLLFWGSDISKLDFLIDVKKLDVFVSDAVYDLLVLYGMRVDLKNNFIQRFLTRQLNLIAGNKPIRSNIGLLKHILLSNENINVSKNLISEGKVSKLISNYKNELNKMKEVKIINNVTYREFCLKRYRSPRVIDKNFLMTNRVKIEKLFPIFCNEVIIKINTNIKITTLKNLCKSLICVRLAKQITSKNIFCEYDDSSCEYTVLDSYSVSVLGSYMNEPDIKSLLAAAIGQC